MSNPAPLRNLTPHLDPRDPRAHTTHLPAAPIKRLDLFVPGKPAPQGSKRHVGGGILVESSKAVGPWRTVVAWHAAQVFREAPLDGPLAVQIVFVMPRPSSTPKRSTPPAIKRPDIDKLARAVLDALSGVVWRDDSQIVDLHPTKRLAELDEQPGAHIRVVAS